ncbi:heavy metal-binding domain-containing protein [Oscillatoria sp. CS-180]|uniref:YbjQ family protein n=1 Tax=Oscillatoria sp. CS-180 TaxID=3021720 RepID=UPI00232F5B84|nr:heavy metal-binding domain-containing protein [Oscillatoria sp. CS-180]MDB9524512.1 heavy metal-binding domain-containing protein [Oscillatoria sp. CS-180]
MDTLLIFSVLLVVGFFAGTYVEKKHFDDLSDREYRTRQLPVISIGAKTPMPEADRAKLFVGSVVVSSDYFKNFVAFWLNLFGGRISVYETLMERGRREAVLRMKEDAMKWGASQVVNVRLETSELGGQTANGIVAFEVIAYGTGIQ